MRFFFFFLVPVANGGQDWERKKKYLRSRRSREAIVVAVESGYFVTTPLRLPRTMHVVTIICTLPCQSGERRDVPRPSLSRCVPGADRAARSRSGTPWFSGPPRSVRCHLPTVAGKLRVGLSGPRHWRGGVGGWDGGRGREGLSPLSVLCLSVCLSLSLSVCVCVCVCVCLSCLSLSLSFSLLIQFEPK